MKKCVHESCTTSFCPHCGLPMEECLPQLALFKHLDKVARQMKNTAATAIKHIERLRSREYFGMKDMGDHEVEGKVAMAVIRAERQEIKATQWMEWRDWVSKQLGIEDQAP